ncbi:hypothetical protein LguiA_030678 [Lonicera macranthoides]
MREDYEQYWMLALGLPVSELICYHLITISLVPHDVHQNQIQFALDSGSPAYLGVIGTKWLPYPSRSFERAHRDEILLMDLDRVLRLGGYFACSPPEAYAQDEEDLRIWREMSAPIEQMCWKIATKMNQTVIWVKLPLMNDCYLGRDLLFAHLMTIPMQPGGKWDQSSEDNPLEDHEMGDSPASHLDVYRSQYLNVEEVLNWGNMADEEPFPSWEVRADLAFEAAIAGDNNNDECIQLLQDVRSSILNQHIPRLGDSIPLTSIHQKSPHSAPHQHSSHT